jgi:hypothetical protein
MWSNAASRRVWIRVHEGIGLLAISTDAIFGAFHIRLDGLDHEAGKHNMNPDIIQEIQFSGFCRIFWCICESKSAGTGIHAAGLSACGVSAIPPYFT